MPGIHETRRLPYSAEQMYDLVADVARYPEFPHAFDSITQYPCWRGADGRISVVTDLLLVRLRCTARHVITPNPDESGMPYGKGADNMRAMARPLLLLAFGALICSAQSLTLSETPSILNFEIEQPGGRP